MRDELYSLLADPGPESWRKICAVLSNGSEAEIAADVAELKRELHAWPPEVERPAPKEWLREKNVDASHNQSENAIHIHRAKISLCRQIREVDLYKLYCDAADDPRLRFGDGTPAVRLQRNFSGTLQGAHGRHHTIGVRGQGDLIGSLCLESPAGRIAIALEVEVKRHSGKQSPEQIQRQEALQRRGEIYLLVRRTEEMIQLLISHRDKLKKTLKF